jgi:hypothetical protein
MKRKGKQAAYFKCITKDCQASLSLKVKDDVIIEPVKIWNHYDNDDDRTNNRIER